MLYIFDAEKSYSLRGTLKKKSKQQKHYTTLSVSHTMKREFVVVDRSSGEISLKKPLLLRSCTRVYRFLHTLLFLLASRKKVNFLRIESKNFKRTMFVIRFVYAN